MSKKLKGVGIVLFLAGFILILNSFSGITGYIIINNIEEGFSSIFGLVLIIIGTGLFIIRKFEDPDKVKVNIRKARKKIREDITKAYSGNYIELKRLIKQAGYNVIEGPDHTAVFSSVNNKIVKNKEDLPIVIPRLEKLDRNTYQKILRDIFYNLEKDMNN
jgi:type IV secretory pathway TrbD component